MNHKVLYYGGATLVCAGVFFMLSAAYQTGREHMKHESVWTEADKMVTDPADASTE